MPRSLTLVDFSDRDLLYAHEEAADDEGWASADDVARQIGIDHKHPAKCVGSRYAWLMRYGVLERERRTGTTFWRINEVGQALMWPRDYPAAFARALDTLDEGQIVTLTGDIARELPMASRQGTHLASRAWRHSMSTWRDPALVPAS